MYNQPYFQYQQPIQQPTLPKQEIMRANGKESVNNLRLAPNSSVLVLDTTAPLVWMCTSDSVGSVSAIPYVISEYKEKTVVDGIEERLQALEKSMEELKNAKPDAKGAKSKSTDK